MGYALYSQGKFLGLAGTAMAVCAMYDIVDKYNEKLNGAEKTTTLLKFLKHGKTNDPKAVAREITRILGWQSGISKDLAGYMRIIRKLLSKAKGDAILGDS